MAWNWWPTACQANGSLGLESVTRSRCLSASSTDLVPYTLAMASGVSRPGRGSPFIRRPGAKPLSPGFVLFGTCGDAKRGLPNTVHVVVVLRPAG